MLSIRLRRIGKKKKPSYRIIVLDKRKDPWGDYLEDLGFYNPLSDPATISVKEERTKYWLSVGAQPSGTLHNLFVDRGLIQKPKKKSVKSKKKKKQEVVPEQEKTVTEQKEAAPQKAASPEETKV